MPELPFYRLVISPYPSLEKRGVKFPLWKLVLACLKRGRGIKGDFNNRPAGAHSKPLCAHPAQPSQKLGRALAGSQTYPERGLPDEEQISGWANVQANNYWSSTTYANNTTNAWNVNMWNGNVNGNNKTNANYAWPVRAGEWLPPLFSFENLYRNYLKCRRNKR
ncbi:MAG: DUF1566 domain-containing protein, partial [Deltaproteobacteria bacterium]|nr:DUF1566 domain-containing protein [Deltaproteobacteria bacterium]